MMGSSAAQQMTTLDGVLSLITNPDMVKKNIEALKEKIVQSESSVALAREEQGKAKELIETHVSRESALNKRETDLAAKEEKFAFDVSQAEAFKNSLNGENDLLRANIKDHLEKAAQLSKESDRLKSWEKSLKTSYELLEREHDRRMAALDKREDALTERENVVAQGQADMKSKIETLRQLAS